LTSAAGVCLAGADVCAGGGDLGLIEAEAEGGARDCMREAKSISKSHASLLDDADFTTGFAGVEIKGGPPGGADTGKGEGSGDADNDFD